jgi:hypothetical protein
VSAVSAQVLIWYSKGWAFAQIVAHKNCENAISAYHCAFDHGRDGERGVYDSATIGAKGIHMIKDLRAYVESTTSIGHSPNTI